MSKLLTKLRNNKKRFTLVELLVVIAIIGVLMAIIIPLAISFMDGSRNHRSFHSKHLFNCNSVSNAICQNLHLSPVVDKTLVTIGC